MTLPYGNSRSIELALAVRAPARDVYHALCYPEEMVRWLGREVTGFTRPGGHLDLLLSPGDCGLESGEPLRLPITIRDLVPSRHIVMDVADQITGRPQPLQIDLHEQETQTVITLSQTGFDPSMATEPIYRAAVRAWNFHLANLKSVLETGLDLRETVHGEVFRFEGTAVLWGMMRTRSVANFAGPRAAAFHALTNNDAIAQWWPGEYTPRDGEHSGFEASVSWGAGAAHDIRGTMTGWSVPEKLRLECEETTSAGKVASTVLVVITEEAGGSRATVLARSGASAEAWALSVAGSLPGWDGVLARLARHVAML